VAGIIGGIAAVLEMVLQAYRWIVIIAVLLQLFEANPANALVGFIRAATEPAFVSIRRRLPFVIVGGFDLSPLVVLAIVVFLESAVVGNLYRLAQ
jgi:YggT family protein